MHSHKECNVPTRKTLQDVRNEQLRHQYAMAVLTGIYASYAPQILRAENSEYLDALALSRKTAFDQADEMLKESA